MSINSPPVTSVTTTEIKGIHQSDIIIRTAIALGIADLRANPWLLDFCFASLAQDTTTSNQYGQKEIDRAKTWFRKTAIPVGMDYRFDDPPPFFVSIGMVESAETEATIGDVHYVTAENTEAEWQPLTEVFDPASYNPVTGIFSVPDSVASELVMAPGMLVVDAKGRTYAVTDIIDANSFLVDKGINADFRSCHIKSAQPRYINTIESLAFRETYRIGCHAHGEASKLTWLYSLVMFVLLRYKEQYLEARGFERSTVSASPFTRDDNWGKENCWVRYINTTGYIRNYWPKNLSERVLSVTAQPIKMMRIDSNVTAVVAEDGDEETASWLAQIPVDGIG